MSKDLIGYDKLVDRGLRGVVREALRKAAAEGWPGSHHAYITFRTAAPGVDIPDSLRARYPDELTIVLQNQFWDLDVGDDTFAVTLSFNKVGQRITVPFSALTSYADPAVKFGLQFQPTRRAGKRADSGSGSKSRTASATGDRAARDRAADPEAGDAGGAPDANEAKVVALDRFRKK